MTVGIGIAIGARLCGVEPGEALKRGVGGQPGGFRLSAYDDQRGGPSPKLVGARNLRTGSVPTRIPVYRNTPRGQRGVEVWPCITFETVGMVPDTRRWVAPRADDFKDPVPGSYVTYTNHDGEVMAGPALRRRRVNPDPYIVKVDISCWSKDDDECDFVLGDLLAELPIRGGLTVPWVDGTTYFSEMRLMGTVKTDDPQPMLAKPEVGRAVHWVLAYEVETWLDNVLETELRRMITEAPEINVTPL